MKNQYLMLLRNTNWDTGMSREQVSAHIESYQQWFSRLAAEGKIANGTPLSDSGRIVSKKGDVVSDGPFIESKESIGGYITLNAAHYDEAVTIAATFPPVQLGVEVEVRQLTDTCLVSRRFVEQMEESHAF